MRRVGFITDSPEVWGAELSLLTLAGQAENQDFQAVILAPRDSPIHARARELGIETKPLDLPDHPALTAGGLQAASIGQLAAEVWTVGLGARKVKRALQGLDLVVGFSLWRSLEVILGARMRRVPSVIDVHETFQGALGRRLSRRILTLADLVIAPSKYVVEAAGISTQEAVVVPRPVASPSNLPRRQAEGPFVVGIFGQLRAHKGHGLAIEGVLRASLRTPTRLLIVGQGGDPEVRELIERAARSHPNVIHQYGPTRDPLRVMAAECDAVVNASDHEAFGRTMIEALAAGVVPIAVSGGGPAEILSETGVGVICERTSESLASAVVEVASNATRRGRAKSLGPKVARGKYGVKTVARNYYAALERVLAR